MDQLYNAIREAERYRDKMDIFPVKIKINREWFEKEFDHIQVTRSSTIEVNAFRGIPFEWDDSIERVRFVYSPEDEQRILMDHIKKVRTALLNSFMVPQDLLFKGDEEIVEFEGKTGLVRFPKSGG